MRLKKSIDLIFFHLKKYLMKFFLYYIYIIIIYLLFIE